MIAAAAIWASCSLIIYGVEWALNGALRPKEFQHWRAVIFAILWPAILAICLAYTVFMSCLALAAALLPERKTKI